MHDDLTVQVWFLRAIIVWAVGWAVLERLRYERRRRKRDKYWSVNE